MNTPPAPADRATGRPRRRVVLSEPDGAWADLVSEHRAELAAVFPTDPAAYAAAKGPFIRAVLASAVPNQPNATHAPDSRATSQGSTGTPG